MPMPGVVTTCYVAEDPDKAWAELGQHFLHEATTYAVWQTPDIKSAVHSHATTRRGAAGRGHLPDPHARGVRRAMGAATATFTLHPLVGGMPIEEGWKSLRLFVEQVVPNLR